jgi:hypothetical protein
VVLFKSWGDANKENESGKMEINFEYANMAMRKERQEQTGN